MIFVRKLVFGTLESGLLLTGATACGSDNAGSGEQPLAATRPPASTPPAALVDDDAAPLPTSTPRPVFALPQRVLATVEPADGFELLPLEISPAVGTSFEKLLSMLPDNRTTRQFTRMDDVVGVIDGLGFDRLSPDATAEERRQFIEEFALNRPSLGLIPRPDWPAGMWDYRSRIDTYTDIGFDLASVGAFASSSNKSKKIEGVEPADYNVAIGEYDPSRTAAALAACECEQPRILEHNGTEYYLWGPGDRTGHVGDRLKRPFYDHIGRGPYLLIRDGEAYHTIDPGVAEEFIGVIQGTAPSLADNDSYLQAVRWVAATGLVSIMIIKNQGFKIEDVVRSGDGSLSVVVTDGKTGEAILQAPPSAIETDILAEELLLPFELAVFGFGWDGKRSYTAIAFVHEDGASAMENRSRLLKRLNRVLTYRSGNDEPESWARRLDTVEIKVANEILILRVYYSNPAHTGSLGASNTLLVHE